MLSVIIALVTEVVMLCQNIDAIVHVVNVAGILQAYLILSAEDGKYTFGPINDDAVEYPPVIVGMRPCSKSKGVPGPTATPEWQGIPPETAICVWSNPGAIPAG